ncbi:MAG: hypothetical protein IJ891_11745 [Prevotella sp.]|nr:hypothetical protein [Prevotella sp.]
MKRFFFIIAALLLSAGIDTYGSTAVPLTVGILDPSSTTSGPGKTPVFAPSLWQDGHNLTFQSMHPAYAIDIVQDGIVVYSVDVDESTTAIVFPSWLSGEFEILLYPEDSDYYFYGLISL